MKIFPLLLALPCTSLQDVPDVIWCDLTQDQLARLSDRDGDGDYLDAFEASELHRDPGSSPRDVQVRVEDGSAVVYWVDTVRDAVFRGVDHDGDGHLSGAEVGEFRSSHALDGSSSPDGLELTDDGAVWWTSDGGSHVGLFRLRDLNGDGNANDAGEQDVMVDGSGVHLAETDVGPVALDADALGRLAAAGNGVVAAVHGDDEAFYRFEDLNGDGDVEDPGETRLFLDASGRNPALPQNPDFASGVLPSLETNQVDAAGDPVHARLSYLTSYLPAGAGAGERVFVFACDSSSTSLVYLNVDHEGLNGLFFRAVDGNGDGDVNDAGEVNVFYDGSVTADTSPVSIGAVAGLDASEDTVVTVDVGGNGKLVHRMRDADGDGAIGESELEHGTFSLSYWGDVEPFPAGHAYLVELAALPAGLLGDPVLTLSGGGCSFLGGVPSLAGSGQPEIGTADFVCRVVGAPPGAPAWLTLGSGEPAWFGAPLPVDLGLLGLDGCLLHVDPVESFPGVADAAGEAAWTLAVSYAPPLVGFVVPLQGLVLDPTSGAIALTPLGETVVVGP